MIKPLIEPNQRRGLSQYLTDRAVYAKTRKPGEIAVGGVVGASLLAVTKAAPGNSLRTSWVLKVRHCGKQLKRGLGRYTYGTAKDGALTLAQAREAARQYLKALDEGRDLNREKRATVPSATIETLFPQWLEYVRGRGQWNLKREYTRAAQQFAKHCIPVIGSMTPREVTRDVLGEMLTPICYTHPRTAEKLRQYLSGFFEWMADNGYRDRFEANPAKWKTLKSKLPVLKNVPVKARPRPMCPVEDLPRFVRLLTEKPLFNRVAAMAALFTILTSVRTSNIINSDEREHFAVWSEIDEGRALWTIPAEKTKSPENGDHIVPLSAQALMILRRLKALQLQDGDVVFPSPFGGAFSNGVFSTLIKRLNALDFQRGGRGFYEIQKDKTGKTTEKRLMTMHGTARATFSTWALDHGVPQYIIEKHLHHSIAAYNRSYQRGDAEAIRRKAAQEWADYCLSEAGDNWADFTEDSGAL